MPQGILSDWVSGPSNFGCFVLRKKEDRQKDRHTEMQNWERETSEKQTDRGRERERERERQKDRNIWKAQKYREIERDRETLTDRQTNRQTDTSQRGEGERHMRQKFRPKLRKKTRKMQIYLHTWETDTFSWSKQDHVATKKHSCMWSAVVITFSTIISVFCPKVVQPGGISPRTRPS